MWLPVAASASAVVGEGVTSAQELHLQLIEGIGGEYAKQALAARSSEEVDDWLSRRTVSALSHWRELAMRGGGGRGGVSKGGVSNEGRMDASTGLSETEAKTEAKHTRSNTKASPLPLEEAAMRVHAGLYPRYLFWPTAPISPICRTPLFPYLTF